MLRARARTREGGKGKRQEGIDSSGRGQRKEGRGERGEEAEESGRRMEAEISQGRPKALRATQNTSQKSSGDKNKEVRG